MTVADKVTRLSNYGPELRIIMEISKRTRKCELVYAFELAPICGTRFAKLMCFQHTHPLRNYIFYRLIEVHKVFISLIISENTTSCIMSS